MIIEKELLFEGSKGERKLVAIFDSGATYSRIHPNNVIGLSIPEKLRKPFKVGTASEGHFIEIAEIIRLDFYIDGNRFSDEFLIVPNLSEQVIIGAATLQKWHFKLDFEHNEVIIDLRVTKIKLM